MKLLEIPVRTLDDKPTTTLDGKPTTLSRSYVHDIPGTDEHHELRFFYYPAKLRPNKPARMRSFYVYPIIVMHNTARLLMGRLQ
jgi:hypothetical protein